MSNFDLILSTIDNDYFSPIESGQIVWGYNLSEKGADPEQSFQVFKQSAKSSVQSFIDLLMNKGIWDNPHISNDRLELIDNNSSDEHSQTYYIEDFDDFIVNIYFIDEESAKKFIKLYNSRLAKR